MNYYSEEEIKRVMEQYTSLNIDALLSLMKPVILPTLESTSSDRERIRMELWKEAYLLEASEDKAKWAVEAFDKQFPG